jgi:alkylation response protein AidB-like acyl-CoA dehydrogenase
MIDMQASPEQQQIVDSVSAMLADALPLERLRPNPQPTLNTDQTAWPTLGALGVFGLGLPESDSGIGYGIIEELLVARAFGRQLLSPSVLATTIAAHIPSPYTPGIRAGTTAIGAAAAFFPMADTLNGDWHLIDSNDCPAILVWNTTEITLIPTANWSGRTAANCIDSTISLERAHLSTTETTPNPGFARHASLLVSAYLVGLAEAACDESVEFAKVRHQFGQPIGAFQAVKHRCADMVTRASAAWNLTVFAAVMHSDNTPDAAFQAIAARIISADAAFKNAATNIQNHGATGYTGENLAHLYLKRAHIVDRMGGDTAAQKAWLLSEPAPMLVTNAADAVNPA